MVGKNKLEKKVADIITKAVKDCISLLQEEEKAKELEIEPDFQKEIDNALKVSGRSSSDRVLFTAGLYFDGVYSSLTTKPDYKKAFKCFYIGWHRDKCLECGYMLVDYYLDENWLKRDGVETDTVKGYILLKKLATEYKHERAYDKFNHFSTKAKLLYFPEETRQEILNS